MPIFWRINCIIIASSIVTFCKRLYGMPYSTLQYVQSAFNRHSVQLFTESDDTICCDNTIYPPEDGCGSARNMSRIIM